MGNDRLGRGFVDRPVVFVASVQYRHAQRAYAAAQELIVPDRVEPIRSKPLPPAAGKFGERGVGEVGGSYRPAGCPSPDQFEARFLFANDSKRPPHAA